MTVFDVAALGENSIDLVCRVAGSLAPNVKRRIVDRRLSPGGQVATLACACAAMGLRTAYMGSFGNDENGARIRTAMETRGVDVSGGVVRDAPNRHAVIVVDDETGDRSVLWERSPRLVMRPGDVSRDIVARTRLLHVDETDEEASIAASRMARERGIPVTTDFDHVAELTSDLLEAVTIPIVSEHFPARLTGEADTAAALRLMRRPHHRFVCATLGARGAMLLDGDTLHHVPAYHVHAVDTTAAGDIFRAAFIVSMLRGDDPETMLRFANAAAAIACTRTGAIDSIPTLEEVSALMYAARTDARGL